ncbi:MAG: ABC transporter ATP-binding protein [Candidatus Glassbacteria bacterium]|nr:ABC transporter ATP-binding protein [Candidatus Glassbacteria bacterium]
MEPLVEASDLSKTFAAGGFFRSRYGQAFRAVERVSLAVYPGETLALVGESGCGKSTTGRLLLGLLEPSGGRVCFQGRDLSTLGRAGLRSLRRRMQMIFQDPYGSLNPRFTVGRTLAEPLRLHLGLSGSELSGRVARLLETVGLSPSDEGRYPHQFSGGQRQRVAIARAVAVSPDFVVADEPVSALDLSVQGQIIRLLTELKKSLGMAMLFISHDLSVVRSLADRVAVMYAGRVVELAPAGRLFAGPEHPYTRLLLDSVLEAAPGKKSEHRAPEAPPDNTYPATAGGCGFHGRCPLADPGCLAGIPELSECYPEHWVACRCIHSI